MAEKKFWFLKTGSMLTKIAAWTFFLFGFIQALAIFLRIDKSISLGVGFVWLIVSIGIFSVFYLISLTADLLLEVWQFLRKERF